ncbi:glycoside hydrolase family 43 protein [Exidia glandulosa HHB12029]|uniref:Glycoside hydrolase family 43 protein n=1 Tax=Exidia glandulosa HHB12029 TaxID=1314781 RepID=A0A166B9D4_EXIGL|nr:glycoside hydrolase family 43 protein [Exidia glandulosa HHB12029]
MFFLRTALLALAALALGVHAAPLVPRATFKNPIKPGGGADPWVLKYGDSYYLTYTTGGDVRVTKSSNLAQWAQTGTQVFNAAGRFGSVWAPELHFIQGAFYIYVAMTTTDGNNANHRMYVLKGRSTTDPTQPFDLVGQITSPDNEWAIDGTVLIYGNGRLYFIWSGWSSGSDQLNQYLYIAPMDSPTHINGSRVLLHSPTPAWQRSGSNGVNEGPEILVHNGRTFLVYSAAGSWTQDYCLAFMGIDDGKDPLVASNWWRLDDRPVFWKSDKTFGVGHASFPYDRNGVPYIVYHGMSDPNAGWDGRTIRTQSYGWNADGSPAFPSPVGTDVSLNLPA